MPSGRIRLARKPMARQRRYHYVKRIFSLSSRGSRIREWADDLQLLDDRAWPTVGNDDRQRILIFGTDVNKINIEPIYRRHGLRKGIQFSFGLSATVIYCPIVSKF